MKPSTVSNWRQSKKSHFITVAPPPGAARPYSRAPEACQGAVAAVQAVREFKRAEMTGKTLQEYAIDRTGSVPKPKTGGVEE